MNSFKNVLIVLSFVFVASLPLYAPPSPPAGGGGAPCWPPPCIPIDGGIGFLIAAGVAFGAKKVYHKSKS